MLAAASARSPPPRREARYGAQRDRADGRGLRALADGVGHAEPTAVGDRAVVDRVAAHVVGRQDRAGLLGTVQAAMRGGLRSCWGRRPRCTRGAGAAGPRRVALASSSAARPATRARGRPPAARRNDTLSARPRASGSAAAPSGIAAPAWRRVHGISDRSAARPPACSGSPRSPVTRRSERRRGRRRRGRRAPPALACASATSRSATRASVGSSSSSSGSEGHGEPYPRAGADVLSVSWRTPPPARPRRPGPRGPSAGRAARSAGRLGRLPGELALAFDLGVELGPEQDRDVRDPQPDQEADDAAQRAVGLVVGAEVGDVEAEADRGDDPDRTATTLPGVIQRNPGCLTFGAAQYRTRSSASRCDHTGHLASSTASRSCRRCRRVADRVGEGR